MSFDNSGFYAKTISEPKLVQLKVDELRSKYSRFEQVWDGLTWHLARRASSMGTAFGEFRLYKTQGLVDENSIVTAPSITILFLENVNEVEIIDFLATHPEPSIEELEF
jgi:hypothetical protein